MPRPTSLARSASSDGGAMNTAIASGIASRTWLAPWTSISRTTGTPASRQPLELGAQRAVAVARVGGVLDEVAGLSRAPRTGLGRRGSGSRRRRAHPGAASASWPRPTARARGRARSNPRISVPLPTPEGPVITKTSATGRRRATQRRRIRSTSSPRCRSESPPIVLLGEIRHCERILLTFTRPYFGTASRRSKTLAVSRYSGARAEARGSADDPPSGRASAAPDGCGCCWRGPAPPYAAPASAPAQPRALREIH